MVAVIQSSPLDIRAMTADDVTQIMSIENASYPYPWTTSIFTECLRVGYVCRVLCEQQHILGYVVLSVAVQECHILNVCVADHARDQGNGRLLIRYVIEQATRLQLNTIYLEVRPTNTHAIGLYHSLGFQRIGVRKDYYPADNGREDAWVMALNMSPQW
ncbi:MAG: ribosomal protein S18-alanine N-acetyltransferase [Gammaproteobacteria bacterium]|nr:ribosomal protein S18-alanine N-acetyltransferase [Gammaproteobacteria bacterium]